MENDQVVKYQYLIMYQHLVLNVYLIDGIETGD